MKKHGFKIILGCTILLLVSLILIGYKIEYSQNTTDKDIEKNENKVNVENNITEDLNDNVNDEKGNEDSVNENVNTNSNNNLNSNTNNDVITDNNNNENTVVEDNNSNIKENNSILNGIIKDDLSNNKTIKVIDKSSGNCAQAIEYFYEDNNYRYYFNCIKSNSMYVIINGKEYKLVEALNNKIVTIQQLEDNGYKFPKENKNTQIR